jgi:hypothetical protein
MRQPLSDPRYPEWHILSTYVRLADGPRRLKQAFRILLRAARPRQAPTANEGSSDHACRHLRPRLDRPPETRPDH